MDDFVFEPDKNLFFNEPYDIGFELFVFDWIGWTVAVFDGCDCGVVPLTPLFGRSLVATGKPFALFGRPWASCQLFAELGDGEAAVGVEGV